jgi:uncharacterized membrane protein
MVNISKTGSDKGYRFILAPNCSISWRELLVFYLGICLVSLAVGLFFTLQGLWLVLPFSGMEMLALGVALYLTSRKMHRREVITLDRQRVRVEKGVQQIDQSWEFETSWTRLIDEESADYNMRRKLVLGAHGNYIEVGEFLDNFEKDELAFKLKDCIIRV